ncbi:hypothetical protein ACVII1_007613 [Bradyrhizobium elkanii]
MSIGPRSESLHVTPGRASLPFERAERYIGPGPYCISMAIAMIARKPSPIKMTHTTYARSLRITQLQAS